MGHLSHTYRNVLLLNLNSIDLNLPSIKLSSPVFALSDGTLYFYPVSPTTEKKSFFRLLFFEINPTFHKAPGRVEIFSFQVLMPSAHDFENSGLHF